jgi:hypothetical protein
MLLTALTIWLILVVSVVLVCRLAAAADRRDDVARAESYPSASTDSTFRVPAARAHAGQYAAGS